MYSLAIQNLLYEPRQDFLPKLKDHLLPRIREIHSDLGPPLGPVSDTISTPNDVLFKGNRFYAHSLLRINYTTYDLRHETDTVNPRTEHRNIMLLAQNDDEPISHPFCYARVLGIYHANIMFTGPESRDYQSRRLEFLWVQWFELLKAPAGWDQYSLDKGRFIPMQRPDAFGFVDPADVL